MKLPLKYAGLFLVVYALFLIATVPASWLASLVKLPKGVYISEVSGTVWQSHIDQISINNITIDDVQLELAATSLITLNPIVNVVFGGGSKGSSLSELPRGEARLSNLLADITLENVKVNLPAQFVVDNIKLPVEAIAHNEISLTVQHFVVGKPFCQELSGAVEWPRAAATAFNETVEVGALNVQLGCQKGNIEATVVEGNNLGLSFSGILARKNRFSGRGYLQPREKFPEKLTPLLGFLGKKDGQGRYALKL